MRCLLTLSLFVGSFVGTAQNQPLQTTRDWISLSSAKVPQTGVLFGFDSHEKQTLGSPYEDSTFQAGTIRFYGQLPGTSVDSLMGVPLRLDLLTSQLEVMAEGGMIRVARAPQVRSFALNNSKLLAVSYYINVREFRGEADQLAGYFEVISAGAVTLLRHPSAVVKRATYNAALNVGSKDDELVCKQRWYVARGQKAREFTPGKRDLLALFADRKDEMEVFLKQYKGDIKSRAGLQAAFNQYNSH